MPDTFTSDDIAAEGTPSPAAAPSAPQPTSTPSPEPAPRAPEASPGAIPFSDHQRVVDGFHERLDAVSWANGLDSARVQEALRLADLYERNPAELYRSLGPRVERPKRPEPDVRDERGEPFYSTAAHEAAVTQRVAEAVEDLRAEMAERLGPLETRGAEADHLDRLTGSIQQATAWPGFNEQIDQITAAIAEANRRKEKLTLHEAYIQIVVPKLSASRQALETELRAAIVAEMNGATRRDDIHPGRAPSAGHVKDSDKSLTDLFREEYGRAARSA